MGIFDGVWDYFSFLQSNIDLVIFLVIAAIGVTAALFVVADKEPMHSAFYLALVFFIVAVMFFLLEA